MSNLELDSQLHHNATYNQRIINTQRWSWWMDDHLSFISFHPSLSRWMWLIVVVVVEQTEYTHQPSVMVWGLGFSELQLDAQGRN